MNDKLLSRFCTIAIIDGISYLLLLGVFMPLKYYANSPEWVRYGGWVHGILVVIYMYYLVKLALRDEWPTGKIAYGFFALFIPFLTFIFENKLRKEAKQKEATLNSSKS